MVSLGNTHLNIWRPRGGWATGNFVRHKAISLCNHFTRICFDFSPSSLFGVVSTHFEPIDRQPSRVHRVVTWLKVFQQQLTHKLFSFAGLIEPQVLSQRCTICHFTSSQIGKLANWLKGSGSALLCLRPLVLITGKYN